jgi:hypothetical protein
MLKVDSFWNKAVYLIKEEIQSIENTRKQKEKLETELSE